MATPFEQWIETSRLRYRVERKRIDYLVKKSLSIIEQAKEHLDFSKAYVSISGGKDSLVMLDIMQSMFGEMPIVHFDLANRAMRGTRLHISELETHYCAQIKVVFVEEYHRRGMEDALGQNLVLEHDIAPDMQFASYKAFNQKFGFEGSFVGIRADESSQRYYAARKPILIYKTKPEFGVKWRVAPIVHWTTEMIWAYIVGKDLPIHQAYVDQINFGVHPDHARIASLALQRVAMYGTTEIAKSLWVDEINQLRQSNPDAYLE